MPDSKTAKINPSSNQSDSGQLSIKNLHIKPFAKSEARLFELMHATAGGLTVTQVDSRQAQFGPNQIKHKKQFTIGKIIADQFRSILVLILIFAAGFSLVIGELVDALAILTIVLVNAVLGFIQEFKAEQSLESLREIESLEAQVIRDGEAHQVPASQVVPGDILVLTEGNKVAADARLLEVHSLKVDESMLTGESVSAAKNTKKLSEETGLADRTNMVYSGTVVTQGKGKALVIRTGMKTEMGKIAHELSLTQQDSTPLQKALDKLGKHLAIISIAIAIPGLVLGMITGRGITQMIMLTISLAVSTIPEGLPIVVTISLALGIKRMVKKNVLIRKLATAESLGGVEVICTDKTGTITRNEMTVKKVYMPDVGMVEVGTDNFGDGEQAKQSRPAVKQLAKMSVLCSDATLEIGDPTEQALLVFAQKVGLDFKKLRQECPRTNELPFSSDKKYMMAQVSKPKSLVCIKGAAEKVLAKADLTEQARQEILEVNSQLSASGLRVLAVGQKASSASDLDQINDFEFLGLVAMYDPPRKEVPEAINLCHQAGIRVMMITGDHKKTALAIAKEVGLDTIGAYTGQEIDQMDQAYFAKVVKEANVFARVSPRHKVQILKKLQELGHQVAMTGDGVNDAPAVKRADVGIAVADGTDLTKGVSDMVLLDNNFSTIADGIHEGRKIFFNIKKFVRFLLSANFDEIARALTSIVLHLPLSLLPIHILWLNLVTDSFPALALTVDEADNNIMSKKPYNPKKEILRGVLSYSLAAAAIGYLVIYGLFVFYLFVLDMPEIYARTVSFTTTVLFELLLVFAIRSERPAKLKDLVSNYWLWLAVLAGALAQLFVVYHPWGQLVFDTVAIHGSEWPVIFAASLSGFLGVEILKRLKVLK